MKNSDIYTLNVDKNTIFAAQFRNNNIEIMIKKIFNVILTGMLLCSISSCSNSEVMNSSESNEDVKEASSTDVVEDDPTIMESSASGTEMATTNAGSNAAEGKVRKINTETFIAEIFDYKANPTKWVYKGSKPAIIDFYADWCGPCKRVAPIMDELAEKYKGQVNFYKINTDEEKELSGSVFGIRSIPSILYVPLDGQPMMSTGLSAKDEYIRQIETNLLKK